MEGLQITSVPLGKGCDITLSQAVYSKLVSEIGLPPLNVLSYKRICLNGLMLYSATFSRVYMRNITVTQLNTMTWRVRTITLDAFDIFIWLENVAVKIMPV